MFVSVVEIKGKILLLLVVVVVVVVFVVVVVATAIIIRLAVAVDLGCLIVQLRGANAHILTDL